MRFDPISRSGVPIVARLANVRASRLSPDGQRIVVALTDPSGGGETLSIGELAAGNSPPAQAWLHADHELDLGVVRFAPGDTAVATVDRGQLYLASAGGTAAPDDTPPTER
jgi:hypothetical protein